MDASLSLFENVEKFLIREFGITNLVEIYDLGYVCEIRSVVIYKAIVNLKG